MDILSILNKSFLLTALICGPLIKILLFLYKRTWLGTMVLCLCRRSIAFLRNLYKQCTGTKQKKPPKLKKKQSNMSINSSDKGVDHKSSLKLQSKTPEDKQNRILSEESKPDPDKLSISKRKTSKPSEMDQSCTSSLSKVFNDDSKSTKSRIDSKAEHISMSKPTSQDFVETPQTSSSAALSVATTNETSLLPDSNKETTSDGYVNSSLINESPTNESLPTQGISDATGRKRPHAKSKRQKKNLKRRERKRSKLENELPVNALQQSDTYAGTRRGIEGSMNSCYMDSLLFSMFYTTSIFDCLMISKETDDLFIKTTRSILNKSVVEPLRKTRFCDSKGAMKLRQHLSPIDLDIMGSFMDAGQLLYILCQQALKEKEFIQYGSENEDAWGDYMHLMCTDQSDGLDVITLQQNMEQSLKIFGDLCMAQVPTPAFILGTPRSNRILIKYDAVIPNVTLSIQKVIKTASCRSCKNVARWEAHDSLSPGQGEILLLCDAHAKIHKTTEETRIFNRENMRLRSIVCIRGVHFVAFTCRQIDDFKTWYFFDSMAGGSSEVQTVPMMEEWLIKLAAEPKKFHTDNIPYLVKRSLTDGHLCIYEPVLYEPKA